MMKIVNTTPMVLKHQIEEAIAKAVAEVRGAVRKEECKPETLYRVQTGAFSDRKNAEAALEKAKAAGFADAFVTDK